MVIVTCAWASEHQCLGSRHRGGRETPRSGLAGRAETGSIRRDQDPHGGLCGVRLLGKILICTLACKKRHKLVFFFSYTEAFSPQICGVAFGFLIKEVLAPLKWFDFCYYWLVEFHQGGDRVV